VKGLIDRRLGRGLARSGNLQRLLAGGALDPFPSQFQLGLKFSAAGAIHGHVTGRHVSLVRILRHQKHIAARGAAHVLAGQIRFGATLSSTAASQNDAHVFLRYERRLSMGAVVSSGIRFLND
jgi:hypothetical protein